MGSSGTDRQADVTAVKCCSWNVEIDLISWLLLLNERAWSSVDGGLRADRAACGTLGAFPGGRGLVLLAANRF